jgi:hypothetical protein
MSVDTAKVQGRRTLKFSTLDDILADVDKLNQGPVRALGNWSPGQILLHLTVPMRWCLDGAPLRAPWYIRVVGWLIKGSFLRNPMPPAFRLSKTFAKQLIPPETSWEDGVQAIRSMIGRMKTEPQRHPSPFLGTLTTEQWEQLHCRHAELHLSFIIPEVA